MIPAYLFKPARKDGWTLLICGSCNQGHGQSHPSENLGLASPRFSPSIPSRRRQKEHTRGWPRGSIGFIDSAEAAMLSSSVLYHFRVGIQGDKNKNAESQINNNAIYSVA
jgi:hypothetical protein